MMFKKANIFTKKDIESKKPGNVTLVGGFSGSGKSALSKSLEKQSPNNILVELDDFQYNHDAKSKSELVTNFFKKKSLYRSDIKIENVMNYLFDEAKKNPDKHYIIEGVQFLNGPKEIFQDNSVILKGTGLVKSSIRRLRRDRKAKYVEADTSILGALKYNANLNKGVNRVRDILSKKASKRPMVYAVDFDGTIVENAYPKIGKPKPKTIAFMHKVYNRGDRISIWTSRGGKQLAEAKKYLDESEIPYHEINTNNNFKTTSPKIIADYYIDDKAVNVNDIEKIARIGDFMEKIAALPGAVNRTMSGLVSKKVTSVAPLRPKTSTFPRPKFLGGGRNKISSNASVKVAEGENIMDLLEKLAAREAYRSKNKKYNYTDKSGVGGTKYKGTKDYNSQTSHKRSKTEKSYAKPTPPKAQSKASKLLNSLRKHKGKVGLAAGAGMLAGGAAYGAGQLQHKAANPYVEAIEKLAMTPDETKDMLGNILLGGYRDFDHDENVPFPLIKKEMKDYIMAHPDLEAMTSNVVHNTKRSEVSHPHSGKVMAGLTIGGAGIGAAAGIKSGMLAGGAPGGAFLGAFAGLLAGAITKRIMNEKSRDTEYGPNRKHDYPDFAEDITDQGEILSHAIMPLADRMQARRETAKLQEAKDAQIRNLSAARSIVGTVAKAYSGSKGGE